VRGDSVFADALGHPARFVQWRLEPPGHEPGLHDDPVDCTAIGRQLLGPERIRRSQGARIRDDGVLGAARRKGHRDRQTIIKFVDNVKVGVLSSVGLGLLLYTVISLMQKIEGTFNILWLVPQERPLAQRFSHYLSVIVIGPVLVFSSLGVSASLQNTTIVETITATEPFGSLIHIGGAVLPFMLVVAALTLVNVFIPNTRVKVASAFAGAVISGLLWNFTSVHFAKFVVSSAQDTEIYAAFATFIIFMLWLYVGWLVLLLGSSVAFYYQNSEQVTLARRDATLSLRLVERLAFAFLTEIANQFTTEDPQTKL